MPIIIGHRGILGDVAGTLARSRDDASHSRKWLQAISQCTEEVLASGLGRFGSGEMPNVQQLEAASLLNPFAISTRSLPCLISGNGGHPILKDPTVTTSEVWALAPKLEWARTYSRLYRLAKPMWRKAQK